MKVREAIDQIRLALGDEHGMARIVFPVTLNAYTFDEFEDFIPGSAEIYPPDYNRMGDTSVWSLVTMEQVNMTVIAVGSNEPVWPPPAAKAEPEEDYETGVKNDLRMMFCDLRDTIKYAQPNEVFRVETPGWILFNVRGGQLIEEVLWELVDQDMGWSIPQDDDVIRVYPTFEPEALLKFDPKPGFADHWTEDEEG